VADIFVSYSKKDWDRVSTLVTVLEARGLSIWWDREIGAGSDFRDVIDQQIRDARCMVVVWSTNANASKWVRDEADEGARRGILVPVLIDRVLPPMGFRSYQAADLTDWKGEGDASVIQQLLADIEPVLKGERRESPAAGAPAVDSRLGAGRRRAFNAKWLAVGILIVLLAGWLISHAGTPPSPGQTTEQATATGRGSTDTPGGTASKTRRRCRPSWRPRRRPPSTSSCPLSAGGPIPRCGSPRWKRSETRSPTTRDWLVANGLSSSTYTVPNPFRQVVGDLPPFVPTEFQGARVVRVIRGTPLLAIYGATYAEGRYLLGLDASNGRGIFAFDFALYEWPKSFQRSEKEFVQMATRWAQVEGDTLYVAHAHMTYAKSSDGYNAYITAIDIPSNRIRWRSSPLVSNAANFVIKGDAIVAGYGFTNEKDSLFVLNKADGRVVQQVPVKSGPSNLIENGDRLHVRTYDTDYVFAYTSAAAPTGR
jgi:hypothetical protein